jgi:hypothetical protein
LVNVRDSMPESQQDDLSGLIQWPREERNLEFKSSMSWSDSATKIKLVKSILAMANLRDGGHIVVGVDRQPDDNYLPQGMKEEHVASFVQDHLSSCLSEYADPYIEVTLVKHRIADKTFCVIRVNEFAELPVLCKKDGAGGLRRGALYTRPRRMVETVEVPSLVEMREVLDLAVEKRHRAFLHQAQRMGFVQIPETDEFAEQINKLPITDLLKKIRSTGYWRFWIRSTTFEQARFRNSDDGRRFVLNNSVRSRDGWRFPISAESMLDEKEYVTSEVDLTSGMPFSLPRIEVWTMFRSGQFVYNLAFAEDFLGKAWPIQPRSFVPGEGNRYLNISHTIKTITCVLEFTARMAAQRLLNPTALISIELHDVDGRELSFMDRERSLDDRYWCRSKKIEVERSLDPKVLTRDAREIALGVTLEIFSRFGWQNPPKTLLAEDQARVLS